MVEGDGVDVVMVGSGVGKGKEFIVVGGKLEAFWKELALSLARRVWQLLHFSSTPQVNRSLNVN